MDHQISSQDISSILCDSCFVKVYEADAICNNCGYPLKGDTDQQKRFITKRNINEIDHDTYKTNIKVAGRTLYFVGASCVVYGMLQYESNTNEEDKFYLLIGNLIVAMAFIALGSWSSKKTLPAMLIGTVLYFTLQVFNMIYDPATIPRNFVAKILIAIALLIGLVSAIRIKKVKKELNIKK